MEQVEYMYKEPNIKQFGIESAMGDAQHGIFSFLLRTQ
jgi:hypothetical protein